MKKIISFAAIIVAAFCFTLNCFSYSQDIYQCAENAVNWVKAQYSADENSPLINEKYLESAGTTAGDWYQIAMKRLEIEDDYSAYLEKITAVVNGKFADNTINSMQAAEWHRVILSINACGGNALDVGGINLVDRFIFNRENLGKQGINGYIWALIALDSKDYEVPENAVNTRESIIGEILAKQLDDGGFALNGTKADPDVTAMALQALSAHCEDERVKAACDKIIACLADIQLESGGYSSWGNENSESTAQVIIALCSAGIDVDDERFVKENSLIDALLKYQMSDGGFANSLDDMKSNSLANEQALCALAAVYCQQKGEKLYWFGDNIITSSAEQTSDISSADEKKSIDIRIIISVSVGIILLIAVGILLIKHFKNHENKRSLALNLAIVAVIGALAAWLIYGNSYQSVEEYYLSHAEDIQPDSKTITLSIDCSTVLDNMDKLSNGLEKYIGNGTVLMATEYVLRDGDNVFDVLDRAVKSQRIALDYKADSKYVTGINHIYEFDCGELSGWMYKVNGEFSDKSCADYVLSDGDVVEWIYTCELGNDIAGGLE